MGTNHPAPDEQARSIFDGLGYEVAGTGSEFSAKRDWKEVHVSAVADTSVPTDGGPYRCFVTWDEQMISRMPSDGKIPDSSGPSSASPGTATTR
jgi:hypothetical protein